MRAHSPLPAAETAGLIAAIGARERTGFSTAALLLAHTTLGVSHCTLFSHDAIGAPRILSGASLSQNETFVFDVFHEYGAGLYAHDSNRRALRPAARALMPSCGHLVRRQQRGEIAHAGYRRFYERGEMVDRVSVLTHALDGTRLALNLYRDDRLGRYRAAELAGLTRIAPVLASAAQQHYALSLARPRSTDWAARLAQLAPTLTPRESAVLCGLLGGATLKEVARALGIAPTSAATYRDRGYARLNVRTLREIPSRLL
jgi:DNA-binding CsgD family transcriptional regulator